MRFSKLIVFCCGLLSCTIEAQNPKTIHVAVYMDRGSPRTPRDMQRVLAGDPRFEVRYLRADQIRDGALKFFDVLVQGGGDSRVQSAELEDKGREAIRSFVRDGGGYIGICAGAHFTVPGDHLKLGILNARVIDNEHWARGNGDVIIKFTENGQKEIGEGRAKEKLQYHQGPLLAPGDRTDLPPYTLLATYETEIAKKGAPHGVMQGAAAIVSAPYGKGRVLVFSPHPEMTRGQELMVQGGLLWAAGRTVNVETPAEAVSAPKAEVSPNPQAIVEPPSKPVVGSGCCGPVTEEGQLLVHYLDSLNVDHLWPQHTFVDWESGEPIPSHGRHEPKTHCSAFAAAAAKRLNIYMMRPPDHKQTLLAAAQEKYFQSSKGRGEGWIPVASPTEAQARANLGQFVVLVYGSEHSSKSGHIAIVRPKVKSAEQMAKEGPQTTQAGGHNFSSGTATYSFVFHPGAWPDKVKMFAHDIDFGKPIQPPQKHDPTENAEDAQ